MTFKEQEQFTKKNSDDLLTELSNYQGENLISEIIQVQECTHRGLSPGIRGILHKQCRLSEPFGIKAIPGRYMLAGTLRWPSKSMNRLSNLFFPFHTEFFWDMNQGSQFNDLIRITPGLCYDISADFRLEFSVSYHRFRITTEESFETNDMVFRLRIFHDIL